ncbi:MAG: hypothetical protein ACM30G_11180 [Micromonosporaceae bacterium]
MVPAPVATESHSCWWLSSTHHPNAWHTCGLAFTYKGMEALDADETPDVAARLRRLT